MGSSTGETDVAGLLKKGFPTSAYNFKAIVNTAEKVNWANYGPCANPPLQVSFQADMDSIFMLLFSSTTILF